MDTLYRTLWFLSLGLTAGLIVSLVTRGLAGRYRWFLVFLCFQLAQSLLMMSLSVTSTGYAWGYFTTQPVTWLLNILVILELYSRALGDRPGIASFSRWAMVAALGVAVGLSALTLSADLSRALGPPALVYFRVVERGILSSLIVFLLLITGFLSWFPLGVKRNIALHAGIFSVYFLATAMAFFVLNVTGAEVTDAVSAVFLIIIDACLLTWLLFLNRRGEEETLVVRRRWRPEDEEKLSHQLDALNTLLLKTSRK